METDYSATWTRFPQMGEDDDVACLEVKRKSSEENFEEPGLNEVWRKFYTRTVLWQE